MLTHFFSAGFRPMFFLGAIWSAFCVALWIAMLTGAVAFDHPWSAVDWHVHEMVFGYGSAALGGFLLTTVPNWTGKEPLGGVGLILLVALWLSGRLAVYFALGLPPALVAVIDASFILVLATITLRILLSVGNTSGLPVVAMSLVFVLANVAFHWQASQGNVASHLASARFGIVALVLMICLIGGRIVPMFTRNWFQAHGIQKLPPTFDRYDAATLIATAPSLALWALHPQEWVTGGALMILGCLHVVRLMRWNGLKTRKEPLLFALHAAYSFVPLGCLLLAASVFWPDISYNAGLHAWTAGAIGMMTITVMTRAMLGHSGRKLQAQPLETAYLSIIAAAAYCRIASALLHEDMALLQLSSVLWMIGFLMFAFRFSRLVFQPSLQPSPA